ncbi:MAG: hypothetical protein HY063_13970 [Bacteroidetes bacterium]|nr:hypothetical protein [Bacteroidota bacterium]
MTRNLKLYISAASILLLFTSFQQANSILIKPGEGAGNIKLNESTLKDLIKEFGKGKKRKFKDFKLCCDYATYVYHYYDYENLGVKFYFTSSYKHSSRTLWRITLYGNCKFQTAEGIQVNKSTRKDIYKIYGPPKEGYGYNDVLYKDKGIAFFIQYNKDKRFANYMTPADTDTLKEIYIIRIKKEK